MEFIKLRCKKMVGMRLCLPGEIWYGIIEKDGNWFGDCLHIYVTDNLDSWCCNLQLEQMEEYFEVIK